MRWIVLVTLPLAGCMAGDDQPVADDAPDPTPMSPLRSDGLSSYLHDVAPVLPGVSVDNAIVEQYRTSVGELIDLDTWIIRPDVAEPVGLVLEVTPYYGGGDPTNPAYGGTGTAARTLVERGFAVGISSVRGTGNSGGCFTQGGPDEAKDTAAVIEHMAGQPWSNGNVGLMGVSYPGTTPQDVWVEAPPSLKAIVPISGISDMYKYNFVNGVPIDIQGFGFNTYYWAMVGLSPAGLSGGAQALDPAHVATAGAGEACTDQADVQEGGVSSTVDGNKDEYWQVRDFLAELEQTPDRERAAVFYIHGLQDWNVKPHNMEGWLPALQASGVPYKVWLGQWGHAWPGPTQGCDESGRSCRADWWDATVVAWFDQFLNENDNGILDAPAVQVQDDDGIWRHERAWPSATETLRFGLADGTLGPSDRGTSSYNDQAGGLLPVTGDPQRVEWISQPFTANATISGMPVFHANVTASGDRASLLLSLAEVRPDGSMRPFNYCAQSLNHVADLENGRDDITGLRQQVHVACFPQDDVVHEGNRLALIAAPQVMGGPNLQPISTGSEITIEHAGAWLDLPIDRSRVVEDPQPYW